MDGEQPIGAVVEAGWQAVRDDGRVRPDLVRAAYAEPRLRCLFPWTGMGELHFSRCTEHRWTWDIPFIRPAAGGTYAVEGPSRTQTVGPATTAREAVAMVVARLPAGCGRAFVGNSEQLAAHEAATGVLTGTHDPDLQLEPPFSTLAAAERAMEQGQYAAAVDLFASVSVQLCSGIHAPVEEDLGATAHHAHLGRMDALARAGRLDELAALAVTDTHARRRLDRQLHEDGHADGLRARAATGDMTALYFLVQLLRTRGEDGAARQAVADIAPDDDYARQLLHKPRE
ncbi:DUF6193 family natural product biosynthesis protein [Micromonospora nigra]|nr:DUF6193 family natural product biosynthesis protein [Micromonospora nigra]